MSNTTTIVVQKKVKEELDALKEFERETYANVIEKLIQKAKADEEDKLEISSDTLKAVKEGREDFKKGRILTTKQLKKELGF